MMGEESIRTIRELREGFRSDLDKHKDSDRDTRLILTAKIVAVTEVLHALGIEKLYPEEEMALKEI